MVFIFKLPTEQCASLRTTISWTSWKHTKRRLSLCWFPSLLTWLKTIGIRFFRSLWLHLRPYWKKLIHLHLMRHLRWMHRRRRSTQSSKMKKIERPSTRNGKRWLQRFKQRCQILKNQEFHLEVTLLLEISMDYMQKFMIKRSLSKHEIEIIYNIHILLCIFIFCTNYQIWSERYKFKLFKSLNIYTISLI